MDNISICFDKLKFNKIGEYNWTEFYPKNWVLASGEFNWADNSGKVFTISISIMKINTTQFETMGLYGNISSDEECRNRFINDAEIGAYYNKELVPEYMCITLIYNAGNSAYKTLSFINDDINEFDDILNDHYFNKAVREQVEILLNA